MKPSTSMLLAVGCLSTAITAVANTDAAPKRNILWMMSDDHAANGVGAYGGRLAYLNPTPTLDRLAAEGTRFSNCFCSNSICTPSRATLMTGQYSHHNGVRTLNGSLPAERQTLALRMKDAGYQTAMVGKWHLKEEPGAFDYYCVLGGQGKYFNPTFRIRGPKPWPQNTFRPSDRSYDSIHSSDAITNASLAWLKKRDKKRPFFLMHHFKAPHDNFENAERYDWLYQDETIPEPENLTDRGEHGPLDAPRYGTSISKRNARRNMGDHMATPKSLSEAEYTAETYQRYLKKYLRCVRGVDDNIARLLAYLEEQGELENTIVLYTSDQGFMLGEHDYIDKRWMYEESMRMPFIVKGPGVESGAVRDELVTNVDFLPTILDFACAPADGEEIDGVSLAPLARGEQPDSWREDLYYRYWMHQAHHDVPAHYGVRTKEFKLVYFYGLPLDAEGARDTPTPAHWELYDLAEDPSEDHNVIDDPRYAEVVYGLKKRLLDLKAEVGDTDEACDELMKVRETTW